MLFIDDAAMIGIRAELVALFGARYDLRLRFQTRRVIFERACECLKGAWTMGGVETTTNAEVARKVFLRDELPGPDQRLPACTQHGNCLSFAMPACQLGIARLDTGRNLAAISRAAPKAGISGIQNNGVVSAA